MGKPKATLPLAGGVSILDRVHQALSNLSLSVTLVGEGPITTQTANLERIADRHEAPGPLGGILASLMHDPGSAWLVLACDLARIDEAAVRWLMDQRDPERLAVIPRLTPTRVEPLFALYEAHAADELWSLARSGSPAPKRLASHPEVATPKPPSQLSHCWTNVNTPEDLETLETLHV